MNGKTTWRSGSERPHSTTGSCRRGARGRWRRAQPAVLGLLLLSAAGCATRPPTVVTVDKPVFLAPPASCLRAVDWDQDADPATNGELLASWDARGLALELANGRLLCAREWAAGAAEALQ